MGSRLFVFLNRHLFLTHEPSKPDKRFCTLSGLFICVKNSNNTALSKLFLSAF